MKLELFVTYFGVKIDRTGKEKPVGADIPAGSYQIVGVEAVKAVSGDTGNRLLHDHLAVIISVGENLIVGIPQSVIDSGYGKVEKGIVYATEDKKIT